MVCSAFPKWVRAFGENPVCPEAIHSACAVLAAASSLWSSAPGEVSEGNLNIQVAGGSVDAFMISRI